MNLAIISPSQNAYSETFIQAHKRIPGVKVSYYYGGFIPKHLEGKGKLASQKIGSKISRHILHSIYQTGLSLEEEALMRSFKKEKIDCVLAEYGVIGGKTMRVCQRLNIPLVTHFHGADASVDSYIREYGEVYNEMFQYASYIVVVSKVMAQKLRDLGCPAKKLVYNPYGPDDAFLDLTPKYSKKQFIGIGRFVDKKAPYYTLLAFHIALQKHPDIRLVIGGDGPLLNTCRNLVKFLEIENNVCFPGVITPTQYREYLKESIAFIQHSITAENGDMEGTPVGILEASAAGLPVISTIHAGIPDVVIHGETGLLCEEHDVRQMAENIRILVENIALAKSFGKAGRMNIINKFSMERHLKVLSEVIIRSKSTVK